LSTSNSPRANAPFFSTEELRLAWERVEDNEGCAGSDGITIERFGDHLDREFASLQNDLAAGAYRPLPLLRIMVEKSPGSAKMRRLLVPAVRDRVLQTAAARRLSSSFEEEFLESSFAYRPGRSVDRAIARVTQLRDRGFLYIVDADIRNFFDTVDQSALLALLAAQNHEPALLRLIESWVRAEYWDGTRVRKLAKGIPQGSPLSPLLANFFLNEFDLQLQKSDSHLVRYGDDFLILCATAEDAHTALTLAANWLKTRKLYLNLEKTRVTSFATGFTFLGAWFAGEHVFIPWKGGRPKGRLLHAAPRMPPALIERYRRPSPESTLERAFRKAGATIIAPNAVIHTGGSFVSHLYVTEAGSVIRKSGERFLIEKEDRILADLPYHKLETILLFGNVQITAQAMAELLDRGILVSLFSRYGKFRGALNPPLGKDVFLRMQLFDLYRDSARTLALSRETVAAKIANGAHVIRRYSERASIEGVAARLAEIVAIQPQLETSADRAALIGFEGAAARAYFTGLMQFNLSKLTWPGRIHHPATDPINALLSLTYTLLLQEIAALLEGHGLDPYIGFLHELDYGRPSLALDLLEPFRHPVADRFVLTVINRGVFAATDFHPAGESGGVYLTHDALKRYLDFYERWLLAEPLLKPDDAGNPRKRPSFRALLRREVENFISMLRGKQPWHPFRWKELQEGDLECNMSSVTI